MNRLGKILLAGVAIIGFNGCDTSSETESKTEVLIESLRDGYYVTGIYTDSNDTVTFRFCGERVRQIFSDQVSIREANYNIDENAINIPHVIFGLFAFNAIYAGDDSDNTGAYSLMEGMTYIAEGDYNDFFPVTEILPYDTCEPVVDPI